MLTVLRYLWAFPNTLLGLLAAVVCLLSGGSVQRHDGVIEASGGAIRWFLRHLVPLPGGATAMTLGHVVIATNAAALDRTRDHERVHVRQYERWGIAFIPAYLLASMLAWKRGQHPYLDNRFEREAFAMDVNCNHE